MSDNYEELNPSGGENPDDNPTETERQRQAVEEQKRQAEEDERKRAQGKQSPSADKAAGSKREK